MLAELRRLRRVLPLLLALAFAVPSTGHAQAEEIGSGPAADPASEPVVDEDSPETIPELPWFEWRYNATVQYDTLARSQLPDEREKSGELRRARLSGYFQAHDLRLKLGVDFADSADLRDVSLEYRGSRTHLELGRFVEPFGLLQSGSSNLAFMERPQASSLAPGYGVGLAASFKGRSWGLTTGIFQATRNEDFFGGRKEDALTLRMTGTPYRAGERLLHIGGAISRRVSEDGFIRFVAIPESVLLLGLNTTSGLIDTTNYDLYGLEFATLTGPVLVQGEWFNARVNELFVGDGTGEFFGEVSPSFDAWYLEASWAVTGERRDYSTRRGTFSGITPRRPLGKRGAGALEFALRYSDTDLASPEVGGEQATIVSAGVNWYPWPSVKLMLEQLHIKETQENGAVEDVKALQLRAQWRFGGP